MTNERPVTIGILGAARVAVYAMIAPSREVKGSRLLAIAARDLERGRAYAADHKISRVHSSYEAMVADPELDLVYVATPPSLHARHALLAIAAGKHVLVEKPFSMTAQEAERVALAAEQKSVKVFEAMHSRHHLLQKRLWEIVRSGGLGRVERAHAVFNAAIPKNPGEFRWNRELGGGALMDLGVYPLAWLRGLFGEPEIDKAHAKVEDGVDAETQAELTFARNIKATMRVSMIASRFAAELVVEGTEGSLRVSNPLVPQLGHEVTVTVRGVTKTETVDGPSTFVAQLANICSTIRDGAPFPLPDRDFVRSMVAIEKVRRAAGV